jgi:hypothetical protein
LLFLNCFKLRSLPGFCLLSDLSKPTSCLNFFSDRWREFSPDLLSYSGSLLTCFSLFRKI